MVPVSWVWVLSMANEAPRTQNWTWVLHNVLLHGNYGSGEFIKHHCYCPSQADAGPGLGSVKGFSLS